MDRLSRMSHGVSALAEMRQFVCWTDTAVRAVTPRDAASLEPGHFQAVHHPLRLQRSPLGNRGEGPWVEESEIVQVLEGPLRPDGYLLVPIIGGSGTGKSHLVKWVWQRTKDRDDWESRYLPKNRTSLHNVISIVIAGLEGPAINDAREALQAAPAQSESDQKLAERLLDELALITAEESAVADATDRKAAQMADKLRRELPDILRDPVVRRRLTGEGAVIPRLVRLNKQGRTDGDGLDDDAMRVVDDDLPLAFAEIGEASKGAQNLLTQLAAIPDLRSAAVSRINEALPSAVKHVFVSSQVDLIAVLREVRKQLLTAGKELVLFIEDLTVLHGVEREFLDAIVEPARSPDGDICALRVLFAVTEGHFRALGLETVRTRCDDSYRMDASYGPDGVDHDEAMSFLGRYLNACRHDPAKIEDLWPNRQSDSWVPNACDVCDHLVHCHETFGRSQEGYGLYPYNPAAVNRFVASLSSERFDPRDVVRQLVDRFLIVASSDLQRGAFPSDELVGPFDARSESLDSVIQSQLKEKRPADFTRVVNSMRYWSEESTVVGDAILAAFGLGALEALKVPPPQPPGPKVKPKSAGGAGRRGARTNAGEATLSSRLRSPWSRIFDDLDAWSGSQESLGLSATNKLKTLVHKSVLHNLELSALPINLGRDFDDQKRFDRERHIHIAGSDTTQSRVDSIVVIERDADTATALQGLILLEELPGTDDYRWADDYRRRAAQYLEQWTLCVVASLEESTEPAAIQAVSGLLVCAIVSGACEAASDPHDYLAALFGAANSAVGVHRSPEWRAAVEAAGDTYRRLRPVVEAYFGEARGTGAARNVRADQLLAEIEDFAESWRLESPNSAIDRFMRSVMAAVEGEWETLELLATGAASLVDRSRSWSEQTERVLGLVEAAHMAGRLPDLDAVRDLRALVDPLQEDAHLYLLEAAELVSSDPPFIERLRVVASSLPDTVATTSRFVARAEEAMSGVARDLDERRSDVSEDETLEDVSSGVLAAIGRLEEAIKELEE